ncbi:hypothetical protein MSG_04121 [Mycobacterium shigaense]|uniref:Uncharacterized protein n=1 Tax=Mycobacterium shigaense TaxID=722731 RepID=A0A1Z4EMX1_9MYCO|nr:hypothetical protein MSG_04121 [Mycobacterium shigaense]
MTEIAPITITNSPGPVQRDESVLRSGGQTKQYPPQRPRIATARLRPPEDRRAPQPQQQPNPR